MWFLYFLYSSLILFKNIYINGKKKTITYQYKNNYENFLNIKIFSWQINKYFTYDLWVSLKCKFCKNVSLTVQLNTEKKKMN